jgi:hypothetical protein
MIGVVLKAKSCALVKVTVACNRTGTDGGAGATAAVVCTVPSEKLISLVLVATLLPPIKCWFAIFFPL